MSSFQVILHRLNKNGEFPNNPRLPLLVYKGAVLLPKKDPASEFEKRFCSNHWSGSWRDKIYPYPHFHSNNHEVLGIYQGMASVVFGGEGGPVLNIQASDVVIIPVGVAHECLSATPDFGVVGAYPEGIPVDECLGSTKDLTQATIRISQVAIPLFDPVLGKEGPLLRHWR